jgi:pilus assembly protein FimV
MIHKLKKIVVAISLIAPVSAYPLGVGALKLNSALNESLNAEIPLTLSANENINDIFIGIASPEKFDEAGMYWHYFLLGIRFNKVSKGNNKYVVELTSSNIVQEPFLDFLLEIKWPNGNLFKSFTALVDPANTKQSEFLKAVQASTYKKRPIKDKPSSLVAENEYGPTKRRDSLWRIAIKIKKRQRQSVAQLIMALYKANPHAFYKKNVNALMAGEKLKIPSNAYINSLSRNQALTEFYFHRDIWTGKRKVDSKARAMTISHAKQEKKLVLVSPVNEEFKKLEVLTVDIEKQQIINNNEKLQAKLAVLEEEFAVMQKKLTVKDKELVALQGPHFPEELGANEEKEAKPVKEAEKIIIEQEIEKSKPLVTEEVVTKVKLEAPLQSIQTTMKIVDPSVNYLNIILVSLAFLVITIGGFFSWRKRQTESSDDVENIFKATDHSIFEESTDLEKEGNQTLIPSNEASFDEKVPEHAQVKEEVMDDVLRDADIYLAYEKYDEAENALRQELKTSSDNDSYKLKLLEVFYSSENNEAFDNFVQELIEEGKRADTIFWGNVSAIGQGFSKHIELFSNDEDPEFNSKPDSFEDEPSLEPEKLDIESVEFTPSTAPKVEEINSLVQQEDSSESLEMFDFSMDTIAKKGVKNSDITHSAVIELEATNFNTEEQSNELSSDEDGKTTLLLEKPDVDIDLSKLTDELNIDTAAETQQLDIQRLAVDDGNQVDDFAFSVESNISSAPLVKVDDTKNKHAIGNDNQKLTLDTSTSTITAINNTGDYETNLDLVKMYVAMDDLGAAKKWAVDVLKNGTDEQKKEAKEVLDHAST